MPIEPDYAALTKVSLYENGSKENVIHIERTSASAHILSFPLFEIAVLSLLDI
jgi:hypothetical protein